MEHFIYALIDPTTKEVRYVGETHNTHSRYLQHCDVAPDDQSSKAVWIRALKSSDLLPELKILEIVETGKILERERYWIGFYLDQNAPLTNIKTTSRPVTCKKPVPVDLNRLSTLLCNALDVKGSRDGQKYSTSALAKKAGVTYGYAYNLLHGKNKPSRDILIRICKALNCSRQEMSDIFTTAQYRLPTTEELEEESSQTAA